MNLLPSSRQRNNETVHLSRRRVSVMGLIVGGWFVAVGVLMAAAALGVEPLERMRTEFVALRYADEARQAAFSVPVDRSRALFSTRRALALAPHRIQVMKTAADVLLAMGEYKSALMVLQQQRRLTGAWLGKELGMCYLMTGDLRRGERLLEQAVQAAYEQRNTRPGGLQAYAVTLNDVGYFYALAGVRLQRAKQYTETAVKINPLESAFVDSLGWVYFKLGRYHDACFYLERAVRLMAPQQNPELHYHLGAAYAREGRILRAEVELYKALTLDPDNSEIRKEIQQLKWELPQPVIVQAMPSGDV